LRTELAFRIAGEDLREHCPHLQDEIASSQLDARSSGVGREARFADLRRQLPIQNRHAPDQLQPRIAGRVVARVAPMHIARDVERGASLVPDLVDVRARDRHVDSARGQARVVRERFRHRLIDGDGIGRPGTEPRADRKQEDGHGSAARHVGRAFDRKVVSRAGVMVGAPGAAFRPARAVPGLHLATDPGTTTENVPLALARPPDDPTARPVWVVDDHRAAADAVAEIAKDLGYPARTFATAESAWEAFIEERAVGLGPGVVVTDLRLPGMDGIALLQRVLAEAADVGCIVVTAHGSIDEAVNAMRSGARDFLTKPLAVERVEAVLRNVCALAAVQLELRRVHAENRELRSAVTSDIVFRSDEMRDVLDQTQRAADSDATVLVLGESGTGKERVARKIHDLSARSKGPFVAAHVAALAEGVLESELFGHEKGAFSGALARHAGRFEQATAGTLFLDEIAEIDPRTQVKLLRVLQERVLVRVGGSQDVPIDTRLVAATHRDLEEEVDAKRFRADLFYRLDVVRIRIPPLRERRDDIPVLLAHFLDRFASRYGRPVPIVSPNVAESLLAYDWPGNVRELENVAERLVVMGATADELPRRMGRRTTTEPATIPPGDVDMPKFLAALEEAMLKKALERAKGNKAQAARSLSLTREGLRYKLSKYGLE
jgi:DNA-binding NtrC family response regulator